MRYTLLTPVMLLVAKLLLGAPLLAADKDSQTNYKTVGENTGIHGLATLKVEGIGLVVGLANTGSDPPANQYREKMLEIMKKKDIYRADDLLASPTTAVVLLRAYIPPGSRADDMVDVEVWLPPGDGATSLKGGRLLEASLFEQVSGRGRSLPGKELLRVSGPVLISEQSGADKEATLKKGKILGQGRVLYGRDVRIILPQGERSGRRTKQLAQRINLRFTETLNGRHQGIASAKDEKRVDLHIPPQYRYNLNRFLQVVRRIPLSVSVTFQGQIVQLQETRLHRPKEAIDAALRLEALGSQAIPYLKNALTSSAASVRFSAAESLAYLGDSSGVPVLGKMAEESPEFRAYALAALVALKHPSARVRLTALLHAPGAETRYGAFRALWIADATDPLLQPVNQNQQEFTLHVVESTGEPMVHVARNFRREVVVFNEQQELQTPISLFAGEHLLVNASADGKTVDVASIKPGKRRKTQCSARLTDILNAASELGASYPELVELLQQARKQGNLLGRLEVNALPRALPLETLAAIAVEEGDEAGADETQAMVADQGTLPSLFEEPGAASKKPAPKLIAIEDEEKNATKPAKKSWFNIFRRSAQ